MSLITVEVSPISKKKFAEILDWIEARHSQGIANHISERFEEILRNLSMLPNAWPQERLKSGELVRKAQINNLTLSFYTVNEKQRLVSIVEILDARTDWR